METIVVSAVMEIHKRDSSYFFALTVINENGNDYFSQLITKGQAEQKAIQYGLKMPE